MSLETEELLETPAKDETSTPTAQELDDQENLRGHVYDGIQEYDNPTPGWWNWMFAGSVAFAAFYFFIYFISSGEMSPQTEYDRAVVEQLKSQFASGPITPDAPTLFRLSKDPEMRKMGEGIFATNCVSCHGRDGAGLVGPNLTDDFYINVRRIEDIPDVVTKGRNNGAMPAWANRLSPNEVAVVSSFVASLRGQNKPGKPVEPNAVAIPPWSDQPTAPTPASSGSPGQTPTDPEDASHVPATLHSDAASLLGYTKDPAVVASGAQVFGTYCAACHGAEGAGVSELGPNLTDDYYLHVRKIDDLVDVVTKGRGPNNPTPMPAWGPLIPPDDITRVAAYVATLRGQNKPGRAPDPNALRIEPWSAN